MSFEQRDPAPPPEPFGGWELMQRDWGVRQREARRSVRLLLALRVRIARAARWLRRIVRAAFSATTAGDGPGTPRSSAPRS